jgi:hypothetical protein
MRRLTLLLCGLAICGACSEPPQKELDRAQGAVDTARAAGAERYANAEFTAAATALQQANEAVAQRDYRLALSRALDASERAQQSARQAAEGKSRARADVEVALARAAIAVQQLQQAIKAGAAAQTPASVLGKARMTASSSEAVLQKARELLEAEQFLDAGTVLAGLPERITEQIEAIANTRKTRPGRRRS